MPIEIPACIRTREVNGIKILLIGERDLITRAAVFEFVAVQRIRLVETLHQCRDNHLMEGTNLFSSTSRFSTPIRLIGRLKQELGMALIIVDDLSITEVSYVHAIGGTDQ